MNIYEKLKGYRTPWSVHGPHDAQWVQDSRGEILPYTSDDAVLMALSPDLLGALWRVTQCLEDWVEVADPDYDIERDREAIAAAYAVIRKATEGTK